MRHPRKSASDGLEVGSLPAVADNLPVAVGTRPAAEEGIDQEGRHSPAVADSLAVDSEELRNHLAVGPEELHNHRADHRTAAVAADHRIDLGEEHRSHHLAGHIAAVHTADRRTVADHRTGQEVGRRNRAAGRTVAGHRTGREGAHRSLLTRQVEGQRHLSRPCL